MRISGARLNGCGGSEEEDVEGFTAFLVVAFLGGMIACFLCVCVVWERSVKECVDFPFSKDREIQSTKTKRSKTHAYELRRRENER